MKKQKIIPRLNDPFSFQTLHLVIDDRGNITYLFEGKEWEKWEYDEENRVTHYENSNGYKLWKEYSDQKLKRIRDNRGLDKIL